MKTTANGVAQHKGVILQAMRNIANALTVDKMDAAIKSLKELPEWRHENSKKQRNWFETKWIPQIKVTRTNYNFYFSFLCKGHVLLSLY